MSAIVLAFLLLFQRAPYVPEGRVTGHILNIDGTSAVAVRIAAIAVPKGNGTPDDNLNYFEIAPPANTTQTDNDGDFILDLQPGRYYIMAGVPGQGTYYPSTTDLKKTTIVTVVSNEINEAVDIKLLQRFGARLGGTVKADMAVLGARTATLTGGKLEDLIQTPVKPDGSFDFGVVPPGTFYMAMYPPTSGMPMYRITVGDKDVTGVEMTPLPTQTVSGRIVSKRGPIPVGYLGFQTDKTYVSATINPDGTFTAQLHAATHEAVMAGLPVGYSVASVKVGSKDASKGIVVGKNDISDVVITLEAPEKLASIRGKISGLAASRYASTKVEISGPVAIIGSMQAGIRPDGTFEFPAVTPGTYYLSLNGVPELKPITLNLDSTDPMDVPVTVPSR